MCRFLIVIFSLAACVVNAQTKEKVTWDYPIKPDTEPRSQFKSMEEMYQACQVPDNVLKQLDTESLVDICLIFPAPPLFPLFNYPQQAFMTYYSNFNGIRELFERKDAGRYLLKKYAKMSFSDFNPLWELYQQGEFISHYKFVEAIIAQPQIIASLDAKDRRTLLKETIRKIDEKLAKDDLFSGYSLEINLWAIVTLVQSENKSLLQGYDQKKLQTVMETGMFVDIDADRIYQQARKYAYENE
jgi:hypothetical protein